MTAGRIYVAGAGMAGLSAAVRLAGAGMRVTLIEGANQAGGRCRSYFDAQLGQTIDNGNHFVLSGNRAVMDFVHAIGSEQALLRLDETGVHFVDFRDGKRWRIAPNDSVIPFWLFDRARRVPDTKLSDYLAMGRLMTAGRGKRIGDVIDCSGVLWDRLLHPFLLGALNCDPKTASAALAGSVVRQSFARGGKAYHVRIAHPTLAAAFIDPALAFLKARGVEFIFGKRVRGIAKEEARIAALDVAGEPLTLGPDDRVVLATPPWVTADLVPEISAPSEFRSIVNAHFAYPGPKGAAPMLGIIGGTAEWVFAFEDRLSVTVSGADWLVDREREELAATLWADVARAHKIDAPLPAWQIVKERRATFAATPVEDAKRPGAQTRWRNLILAGDWTQTGLPATIEGALRSGEVAARIALRG